MIKKNKKVSLAKKPFLVLSRRAIAGWLVVMFVVSGWMFAIGVLVGRGTAPIEFVVSKPQRELEIEIGDLLKKEQERSSEESDSGKGKNDLDFYEALPDNRVDAKITEKAPAPITEKKSDPPPDDKPDIPRKESKKKKTISQNRDKDKSESPDSGPAKPLELTNSEPAKPSEPAKIESKGDTKPAGKPYAIQVAAFKSAEDADHKVAELKAKGFSASRAIGKVPGQGIWYRVRIGDFRTKAEADDTMSKLRKAGMKPILVER